MSRPLPRRGFSLIEVMMTAAIAGVLASIAIPVMTPFMHRSKMLERDMITTVIVREVRMYMERTAGAYVLDTTADPLPAAPLGPGQRAVGTPTGDWLRIGGMPVTGMLYFQYTFHAEADPTGTSFFWVKAEGDLDGNGVNSSLVYLFTRVGSAWVETKTVNTAY